MLATIIWVMRNGFYIKNSITAAYHQTGEILSLDSGDYSEGKG